MHKLILSFKDRLLKVYSPKGADLSIGRHPECDIHIDNLAVAPIHAKIHLKDHKAVLTIPNKDFKVLINNKMPTADGPHILGRGDKIQIGKHTVTYVWESDVSQDEQEAPFKPGNIKKLNGWLQVMSGPRLGRTVHLNKPRQSIGPDGKQGILITNTDEGYFLAHLDDALNVSVNDADIGDKRIHLQNGNTIKVGDMEMLFYTQD